MANYKVVDADRLDADLTAVADKIRENGGTADALAFPQGYVDAVGAIKTGGGGGAVLDKEYVKFYDYDGTLLYSYDAEEVAAMTELPPLPEQKGLICQGWNWTLDDIKAEGKETNVGATYITDDGKTRMCITTGSDNLSVVLCISASGTVDVDWGDGSAIEQLTGTIEQTHVYAKAGDYAISLDSANAVILGLNSSNYPVVYIPRSDGGTASAGSSLLRRTYIGENVTSIGNYAFLSCYSLTEITIPNSVTSIGNYAFQYCYLLKLIDLSTHASVPTLSNANAFSYVPIPFEIRVPAALYDEWIAATNWSTYADQIVAV